MRKLLLSLCALSAFSTAFANSLDNGNYTGYLQSTGYPQDSASGTILNDGADIKIPTLTSLGATNGHLTGTINGNVNTNPSANCIDNAVFTATKVITIKASSVVLTNCVYQNHTFTGSFDAVVFGMLHNTGTFSFTLQ